MNQLLDWMFGLCDCELRHTDRSKAFFWRALHNGGIKTRSKK
jgi:hypothetical protein